MSARLAFLGLGTMGAGMAGRLADAGFDLTVWNRRRGPAEGLVARGVRSAVSPAAAAAQADVVISMVSDDQASRSVWLGTDGALRGVRDGAVLIESSTVSPGWIRELAAAAAPAGCGVLDAPVTGSRTHAANGELLFLAGGDAALLDRVRPVLAPMSRGIVHVGPLGSGAMLKLVNNFICGVQAAALAEGLAMIERSGLDRDRSLEVLLQGAPGSPLVKTVAARMLARDYTVHFRAALMGKDLRYAIAEARELGVPLETAQAALRSFDRAVGAGRGEADMSVIVEPLRAALTAG
jgi:3-hydroxyisobutyrate dehydrogenase